MSFCQGEKWTSHPDTSIFHSYTSNDISVEKLQSRASGRFILVYYYEHFSMRVNHFNQWVMGDTSVYNFIQDNFYPVCIDLDIDKMGPNEADIKRSKTYRKFLRDQAYYVEKTPAFSIYNPKGELKGTKTFLNAKRENAKEIIATVLDWMKKRLIE